MVNLLIEGRANVWVMMISILLSVTGCNDHVVGCVDEHPMSSVSAVSTNGVMFVEAAMPAIRNRLLHAGGPMNGALETLFANISVMHSDKERICCYRYFIDSVMAVDLKSLGGCMTNDDRARKEENIRLLQAYGTLDYITEETFVRLSAMHAPLKEQLHVWLMLVKKMQTENACRKTGTDYVEMYVNKAERIFNLNLGRTLKDRKELSEIEAEFLQIVGRPIRRESF